MDRTQRLAITAAVIVLGLAFDVQAVATITMSGRWTAEQHGPKLHFNLRERGGQHGFTVEIASLSGIDERRIVSSGPSPVFFELRRAAGIVEFLGSFDSSRGSGNFRFTPSEAFVAEMGEIGYTGLTVDTLLLYTATNLTPAWIRELRSMGYTPARSSLDDIAIFKITPEYIEYLREAGYANIPLQKLIQLRMAKADELLLKKKRPSRQ